eukprot:TRINITY_DN1496_c4_g1_i1.p1 TRINITY_DN1496_c4_g1~~TRINITY_DN1496_c4_g1_i1.p1  ORF type:complete len:511 (+),score=216.40 TRINITY_DN1496_c4_g1_i1:139-1671(+)
MSDWKDSPTTMPRRDSLSGGMSYGQWGGGGQNNFSDVPTGQVMYGMPVQPMMNRGARVSPHDRRGSTDKRGNSPTTMPGNAPGTMTPPTSSGMYDQSYGHRNQYMNRMPAQQQGFYQNGVNAHRQGNFGTPERMQQQQQQQHHQQHQQHQQQQQQMFQQQFGSPLPTTQDMHQRLATRENATLFEKILQQLYQKHMANLKQPADTIKTLLCLEDMFWDYLPNYAANEAYQKQGLPTFEKGLFKDFLARVLAIHPTIMGEKKDGPEKAAETYHRDLCEYKLKQPVAGVALVTPDMGKILLMRNKACTDGWALPKGKIKADEKEEAAARRILLQKTGISVGSRIMTGTPVRWELDRGNMKQLQTIFIVPVPEADITIQNKEQVAWKPTQPPMPYLQGKPTNVPPEYETLAVSLQGISSAYQQMLSHSFVSRNSGDGPPVRIKESPAVLLDYDTMRDSLLKQMTPAGDHMFKSLQSSAPRQLESDENRKRLFNFRNTFYIHFSKKKAEKAESV